MKKKAGLERIVARSGWLFILPWLIGLVYFVGIPLIQSLVYMFSKLTIKTSGFDMEFIGFENIKYAVSVDPDYIKALVSSFSALLWQVPLILVYSMFFGVMLNQKFRGRTIVRAIMFIPVIIASGVVMSVIKGDYVAQTLLTGEKASSMFQITGIQDFLMKLRIGSDLINAMMGVVNNIFELSWRSGIQILLMLAALQGVPQSYYEVSRIEGATGWETFWKITFPLTLPIVFVNVIFTIIESFTDISSPVMTQIAKQQNRLWIEYAATQTWIYSLIVFAVVGLFFLIIQRRITYAEY